MAYRLLTSKAGQWDIVQGINYILKYFERVQKKRIIEVTADYTITLEDHTILCDATSGNITVTLPTAYLGDEYYFNIKKVDSSANTVTIDGSGSETVDGATTKVISTQYDCVTIQSDGAEWWII